MATVYFGCSMRGGFGNVSQEELQKISGIIESFGLELATKHNVSKSFVKDEEKFTKNYIHDRDYQCLKDSDIGIFEISNPSLGVGSEISDMLTLGKPVLCLYKKGLKESVSAYILGKEKSRFVKTPVECREYESLLEAEEIIKRFAKKHQGLSSL